MTATEVRKIFIYNPCIASKNKSIFYHFRSKIASSENERKMFQLNFPS